jgi:hypothetical protein
METAQLPIGSAKQQPFQEREDREGEPGALHLGADASRIDGPHRWCWDSVVLAMKNVFKAQAFRMILALATLASSALVIEAGHRW